MKKIAAIFFIPVFVAVSCGRQIRENAVDVKVENPGKSEKPEMAVDIKSFAPMDVNRVFTKVDQLIQAEQTNQAINVLSDAFEACNSNRGKIFTRLIGMLYNTDGDARDVCMRTVMQGANLIRSDFNIIDQYDLTRKDNIQKTVLLNIFYMYNRNRTWFFTCLLNSLLQCNDEDYARNQYFAVIGQDMNLTRAGFGILYRYYQEKKDTEAVIEWTKMLVDAPLPDDLSEKAFGWHMQAWCVKGPFDEVLMLVPVCVKKFNVAVSLRVLNGFTQFLFKSKEYDNADSLITAIEKESGISPDLCDLAVVLRTELLFSEERWSEAEKQFEKAGSILPDGELRRCFKYVAAKCIQEKQYKLVDRLCDFVLRTQTGKKTARIEAARQWLAIAKMQKHVADIPGRLQILLQLNISPDVFLSIYDKLFYFVISDGTRDDLLGMLRFNNQLAVLLEKEEEIGLIKVLGVDGSFMLEDYDGALKILKQGIPDRDEDWHKIAINKGLAHLALQQGRKKEAIKRFRAFMEVVSERQSSELDPLTGIMHSKEMCLGFNAKRIGDILASMGDIEASRRAYDEAEQYYQKAIKEIKPDTHKYEYVQAQINSIRLQKKNL